MLGIPTDIILVIALNENYGNICVFINPSQALLPNLNIFLLKLPASI